MYLFHGSNVAVDEPRIIVSNRTLDFGAGFYVTADEKQAEKWAKVQTLRRQEGRPTVSVSIMDEKKLLGLNVKHFGEADAEWLRFVCDNRRETYSGENFDIVMGPIADDSTMSVINSFVNGKIDEETALVLLKPQKLSEQIVFLSEMGLGAISFREVRFLD